MSGSRRYVALLRAVNVLGHGVMRMADLRAAFESFGVGDVATYIQTGNVLFTSKEADPERLARWLERKLDSSLGYKGTVFVRTPAQLKKAAANNPFEPVRLRRRQRCHLVFLSGGPAAGRVQALMALQGEEYRFAVRGKVLYYAYDMKFIGRRRSIDFERVLGVAGTARHWTVVDKLIELSR